MRILFFAALLLTALSCVNKTKDYFINLENNSDRTIIVLAGFDYPNDSTYVLDCLWSQQHSPIKPNSSQILYAGYEKPSSWYINFYISQTECSGYISFYIMDIKVKALYDLETIEKDYMILARYDVTQDDIERLDWTLSYPPTPEMQGIHMWLSY